jgi:hypothetical protein
LSSARSPDPPRSEPESQEPATQQPIDATPARHILRQRTVERFRSRPNVPEGAIPAAVRKVIGGPMMWSERPIRETQFTPEQRDLMLRAADEIRDLYRKAGGSMDPPMMQTDALGLMPENAEPFPSKARSGRRPRPSTQAWRFPSPITFRSWRGPGPS